MLDEPPVDAGVLNEHIVGAGLDEPPSIEHEHTMRALHCREAMRNDQHGTP